MASVTARATAILSYTTASGRWKNIDNLIDNDDASYATAIVKSGSPADVILAFDFSAIPSNAIIDDITFKNYTELDSSVYCYLYTVRKYENGTSVESSETKQTAFGSPNTATENVFTQANGGDVVGTWTAAELNQGINTSSYTGLGLYFRLSSVSVLDRYAYPRYVKATVTYHIPTYTITANAGTGGTVTGGGSYESGTTATLTATPNTGYKFKQWTDGNTNATRSVTVTANATYTAIFEESQGNCIFVGTQPVIVQTGTVYLSKEKF